VATANFADVRRFYQELLDLDIVMDFGWIAMLSSGASASVQINIASQGGSDTTKPDPSIEVDDVDEIYQRAEALRLEIEYGLVDGPWGVRRFYVCDPAGKLLNVLSHIGV
jgi:catechol 2,3-dioxygenase-like lactoylglutathione lyase family enzyme